MAELSDVEVAIPFWKNIAKTLGCHTVTACKKKPELLAAGVIFYRRNKQHKRIVHHFPSRLKAWIGLKAIKGEIV